MVLSSGAFKCLTSTLPEQEWELPVTVRSSPDGGAMPTRVFVDNPLLPPRLSLRAKNELFYKARRVAKQRCALSGAHACSLLIGSYSMLFCDSR